MKTRIVKVLVNHIDNFTKGYCYYLFKGGNKTEYSIVDNKGKRHDFYARDNNSYQFVESSSQYNPMSKAQFENCVLRRVGHGNHRFTVGRDYEIFNLDDRNEPYITDDNGKASHPKFQSEGYWEVIHKPESVEIKSPFKKLSDFNFVGVDEAATLDKTAFFNIDPRLMRSAEDCLDMERIRKEMTDNINRTMLFGTPSHDRSMSRMMRQGGKTFELAHDLAARDMREHIENTMLYGRSMIDTGKLYNDLMKPTTKENDTMRKLKIETKTLINGNDAADYSVDSIVEMIQEQEQQIEKLKQVKSESKAIKKLVDQCQQNIDKLIAILDARDE